MRIGHYAPKIWARGGIATYVRRLSNAQKTQGHETLFLTLGGDVPTADTLIVGATEIYETARRRGLDVLHLHKEVAVQPPADVATVRTMHGNQGSCPSGSRYLAARGVPCNRTAGGLICTWGHIADRCGSRNPARISAAFRRLALERKILPTIHTMTVSAFLRDRMVELGYPPDRILVTRSAAPEIDNALSPIPEGVPRFLFAGRIVPEKGIFWLIRALTKTRQEFFVDIAGEGYVVPDAKRMAQELGVADRVRFHGWIEADGLDELYEAAHAVLFPSVWHEPAGLVSLEAAAHGRAVIAGAVGGIPEYALPEYALLVAPNNDQALAEAMDMLAGNRTLATEMGTTGRNIVNRDFTMESLTASVQAVYEKAIQSMLTN